MSHCLKLWHMLLLSLEVMNLLTAWETVSVGKEMKGPQSERQRGLKAYRPGDLVP